MSATCQLTRLLQVGYNYICHDQLADVAQWQSSCFVNSRLWVRVPPSAPLFSALQATFSHVPCALESFSYQFDTKTRGNRLIYYLRPLRTESIIMATSLLHTPMDSTRMHPWLALSCIVAPIGLQYRCYSSGTFIWLPSPGEWARALDPC